MTSRRKPFAPLVPLVPSAARSPVLARPAVRSAVAGDAVHSLHADETGAVLAVLGADRRLVINGKGNRYQLQQRLDVHGWAGLFFFASKSALLAKFAGDAELAAAVLDLPEKPSDVVSDFVVERQRQAAAFRASDYGRDAYPRVLAQVEDWRLVVDPDGSAFRLMFVHVGCYRGGVSGANMWISSVFSDDLDVIRGLIGRRSCAPFGAFPELWGSAPDIIAGALLALPRFVADLPHLPDMPARPVSVRRQAVLARSPRVPSGARRLPSRPKRA